MVGALKHFGGPSKTVWQAHWGCPAAPRSCVKDVGRGQIDVLPAGNTIRTRATNATTINGTGGEGVTPDRDSGGSRRQWALQPLRALSEVVDAEV
jgi:hypothetical protein